MDDGMVRVELVGGPLDGETQEHALADLGPDTDAWGTHMVVDGPRCHPHDPAARAVYEPEDGGDPHRWTWRGWSP
ncbi:hypothetical protein [Streptomonospora wellingtoniae]|uniref:Uncharacterized protein n=1 Tax=Streptomonospora wellingtoniae TaxID=3075544 RepID=A0ABU2KUE9_9ACTN|nr:hypothetical protein [Streptomonospora sp. DSM 45055]MDT0302883.1 hypothetical protein [Streptomonospora sp. DSM 45055]